MPALKDSIAKPRRAAAGPPELDLEAALAAARESEAAEQADALGAFRALVRALAGAAANGDPAFTAGDTANILATARRTADDLEREVGALRDRRRLGALAVQEPALAAKAAEARGALTAAQERHKAEVRRLEAALATAQRAELVAASAADEARSARRRLEQGIPVSTCEAAASARGRLAELRQTARGETHAARRDLFTAAAERQAGALAVYEAELFAGDDSPPVPALEPVPERYAHLAPDVQERLGELDRIVAEAHAVIDWRQHRYAAPERAEIEAAKQREAAALAERAALLTVAGPRSRDTREV